MFEFTSVDRNGGTRRNNESVNMAARFRDFEIFIHFISHARRELRTASSRAPRTDHHRLTRVREKEREREIERRNRRKKGRVSLGGFVFISHRSCSFFFFLFRFSSSRYSRSVAVIRRATVRLSSIRTVKRLREK